jgi:hypothetical protein
MPWRRRKEDAPDDAELRDLLKEYSRVHGYKLNAPGKETSEPAKSSVLSAAAAAPPKATSDSSLEEVIQGESFSYTKKETIIYADEEPCDSWRHIDVPPLQHC